MKSRCITVILQITTPRNSVNSVVDLLPNRLKRVSPGHFRDVAGAKDTAIHAEAAFDGVVSYADFIVVKGVEFSHGHRRSDWA